MKINVKKILEVFDELHDSHDGLTTSIISLIGEDLAAGSFLRFQKGDLKMISGKFQAKGFSRGHGPRLDKWFVDDKNKVLYQCEIKNWCSRATIGFAVDSEKVTEAANKYWNRLLKGEFERQKEYGKTNKVLVEMVKPNGYENYTLESLLILWWPITPPGKKTKPLFKVQIKDLGLSKKFKTDFTEMNIFSISLYLREQQRKQYKNTIDIEMSDVKDRLQLLAKMIEMKT